MKSEESYEVPIWKKFTLTIEEATKYFGVGEKKLRKLVQDFSDSENCFSIQNGNKILINRVKLETFLNQSTSI